MACQGAILQEIGRGVERLGAERTVGKNRGTDVHLHRNCLLKGAIRGMFANAE